jgi:hypothetical protein
MCDLAAINSHMALWTIGSQLRCDGRVPQHDRDTRMPSDKHPKRIAIKVDSLPQSWSVKNWPAHVAPGGPVAGRAFIRRNMEQLLECGALSRVGKELVVLGAGYALFLSKNMTNVRGWMCPANKRRQLPQLPAA